MNGKLWRMGRWEPDSRGRMQQAALALFAERGYAGTTAAEIADCAGVTERTFFRHFTDKREVLFANEDDPRHLLTAAVAAADQGAAPVDAVAAGLDAVAAELQGRREAVVKRAQVVAEHAELRERELMKLTSWSDALENVLRERGLPGPDAELLAEVSVAVFRVAYGRWLEGPEREFVATIREALAELDDLIGHPVPGRQVR